MTYLLECDTCEFARRFDDRPRAYATAKDHEAANPAHFVFIELAE